MTRQWPRAMGPMSMNARIVSVSRSLKDGMSPGVSAECRGGVLTLDDLAEDARGEGLDVGHGERWNERVSLRERVMENEQPGESVRIEREGRGSTLRLGPAFPQMTHSGSLVRRAADHPSLLVSLSLSLTHPPKSPCTPTRHQLSIAPTGTAELLHSLPCSLGAPQLQR